MLSVLWFEEAGCHARGLKKQVVRPAGNSLKVREVVGEVFSQREPKCSHSPQRIPLRPVVEALDREVGQSKDC
jgi:hypothetical protein